MQIEDLKEAHVIGKGELGGTFYSHPVKQKNSSLKIEYLSLVAGFRRTSPAVVGDGESLTNGEP